MNKKKALIIAIQNFLDFKVEPDGFVREPLYLLLKSYREFLVEEGEEKQLNHYNSRQGKLEKELEKLYK